MILRSVEPDDYLPIISVIDSWWGGRHMADMLPKLFFVHFRDTSFIAEDDGARLGFLIGFISQSAPSQAYIHFVGVHPDHRQRRIGEALYERFFETVKSCGCTSVHCVTSPVNKGSVAFHTRMGFTMEPGDDEVDGLPVKRDYDGAGQARVCFVKSF